MTLSEKYIQYGVLNTIADELAAKAISVSTFKRTSQKDLQDKYDLAIDMIQFVKDCVSRKPIPEETVLKLLQNNNYTCCLCKGKKSDAYIIHHIEEYSKSQDNTYDNLAVLCPNDHDLAHREGITLTNKIKKKDIKESKLLWEHEVAEWNAEKARNRKFGNQFNSYLKSLQQNIQKIKTPLLQNNLYIENTVSISLTPLLDSKPELQYEKKNDIKTLDFFIKKERIILIEGNPNGGKSILLKRFTHYLCTAEGQENSSLVPLLIELSNCLGYSLEYEIQKSLLRNGIDLENKSVEKFLQATNLILLLDGFDENIGDKSKIGVEVKRFSQLVPIIITSRAINELSLLKSQIKPFILKLDNLKYEEQEHIIVDAIGEKEFNHFLNQITADGIRGLESNPLYLQLLIQYYKDNNKKLTDNIYKLYDDVLAKILIWRPTSPPPEVFVIPGVYSATKNRILEELAYHMLVSQRTNIDKQALYAFLDAWLLKNDYRNMGDKRDYIFDDLITSRLLIENEDKVSFFHRSIMDYFSVPYIERENKKLLKKRFYSESSYYPLVFLFSKRQTPDTLYVHKPQKRYLVFLGGGKASTWILNYSACLRAIKKESLKEKSRLFHLIQFLLQVRINREGADKITIREVIINLQSIFYDATYGFDDLIKALGLLNYDVANDYFLDGCQKYHLFRFNQLEDLNWFNFHLNQLDTLINLYLSDSNYFVQKNHIAFSISKLIILDADQVVNIILTKIKSATDTAIRNNLIDLMLSSYFTRPGNALNQNKVLAFLVEELLYEESSNLHWSVCNKLTSITFHKRLIKNSIIYSEHMENVVTRLTWAIDEQNDKRIKKNAVKAIGLYLCFFHHGADPDIRFEDLFVRAIEDDDTDVLGYCLSFNGKYQFCNHENEEKFFNRVLEIYHSFPLLADCVIQSIDRAKSSLTDKDIDLVLTVFSPISPDDYSDEVKSKFAASLKFPVEEDKDLLHLIKLYSYFEMNAAFDIIIHRNITVAKAKLESVVASENITDYVLCRSIEALVYLDPTLYLKGYMAAITAYFNTLVKTTLEIEQLESLVEKRLSFVGDAETIKILGEIKTKFYEDRFPDKLKRTPLHFIYPANKDPKKEKDLWRLIPDCIHNIEKKMGHVEKNCQVKILQLK